MAHVFQFLSKSSHQFNLRKLDSHQVKLVTHVLDYKLSLHKKKTINNEIIQEITKK